jgi:hypothetical protein
MPIKLFTTDFISVKFMEDVGFEALPGVVKKSSIFWNITACSPFETNRCFGGTLLRI